jgi:transposase InsO family protein
VISRAEASRWFGVSRQAHHQSLKRQQQHQAQEQLIVELVQGIRHRHPRMGGRKLLHELRPHMALLGITRGRDAFFELLSRHDLLVPDKRSRRRTTRPGLWKFPNLLAEVRLSCIQQVWVGDITYITTEGGFAYLSLLTDAFSRFIVGYDLSTSLAMEGCLRTLDRALKAASSASLHGLIHHSDHGVQYTSWPYCEQLQAAGIRASMGEVGNCYENALAERVNGILKIEYGLDGLFVDWEQANAAVQEAIWLYNYERPHLALNYRKPADVHFAGTPQ